MPLPQCIFRLNGQSLTTLVCGSLVLPAFSGEPGYVNDPNATGVQKKGPLPKGRYYIIDRQSGGRLGWLYDPLLDAISQSDRHRWFSLYRNDGVVDDWTVINGVRRGQFRIHPIGRLGVSEGCITLTQPQGFEKLSQYLRSNTPAAVPGTSLKYYGTVDVQ